MPVFKPTKNQGRYNDEDDPFLFMDCLITKGKCKALVLCVGEQSSRDTLANKLTVDEGTELGVKL